MVIISGHMVSDDVGDGNIWCGASHSIGIDANCLVITGSGGGGGTGGH